MNYSSYSKRYRLIKTFAEKLKHVSTSSQRLDTFSPTLARVLHARNSNRATFAVEAGSQRMRNVVNKEITNEHIDTALKTLIDLEYRSVKIYMISGLPFETQEDALEIIKTLEPIVRYAAEKGVRFRIELSYTQFTAKPFTALQWADVSEVLDAKSSEGWGYYEDIKNGLASIGIRAKRSLRKAEHIMLQLLNRVDRRFTKALIEAVLNDNLIYPFITNNKRITDLPKGTEPSVRLQAFIDYLDRLCLKYTEHTIHDYFKEIPTDKNLPWDVLSTGVSKDWLVSEYINARRAAVTKSCMSKCTNCGICANPVIKSQYSNPHPRYTDEAFSNDISDTELASLLVPCHNESRGKILVHVKIPQKSRFTESAVLHRQLILAFNNVGMYVDNVTLESELIHYRAYRNGVEFGILNLRSDATRRKLNNTLLSEINDKLEDLIKVENIRYSKNPRNDTLFNIYTHALYKLEVYPRKKEDLKESLFIMNEEVEFQQTSKKYDIPTKAIIPFVKVIKNSHSFFAYALVPLNVNVYYLLKHLTSRRDITGLMRQPLERLAFISVLNSTDMCTTCGKPIETIAPLVSVESRLLKTREGLCASCLIDKGLI